MVPKKLVTPEKFQTWKPETLFSCTERMWKDEKINFLVTFCMLVSNKVVVGFITSTLSLKITLSQNRSCKKERILVFLSREHVQENKFYFPLLYFTSLYFFWKFNFHTTFSTIEQSLKENKLLNSKPNCSRSSNLAWVFF